MKKQEFLETLQRELEKHGAQNSSEILSDYQEHFDHGAQSGKSEEEISQKLGNPSTIAHAFAAERLLNQVKESSESKANQFSNFLTVLGKLLIIAPLNFFIFSIPGLIVFFVLSFGWFFYVLLVALLPASLQAIIALDFYQYGTWATVTMVSGSLAFLMILIVLGMILYVITRYVILAMFNFLQWNVKFILEK